MSNRIGFIGAGNMGGAMINQHSTIRHYSGGKHFGF